MIGLYAFVAFIIAACIGAWWNLRTTQAQATRRSKWQAAAERLSECENGDEACLDAAMRATDSNSTDPCISDSPAAGILAGKPCLDAAQIYRDILLDAYGGGKNIWKAGRARIIDDDLSSLLATVAKEEEPGEIQVVNLSLGLCTRAYRLKKGWRPSSSAPVSLIWFEVEPLKAADRRRSHLSIPKPAQLESRSVPLSLDTCSPTELFESLKGAGYSSLSPTVFVLEGILSRWPLERALSFLSDLALAAGFSPPSLPKNASIAAWTLR